MSVQHVFLPPLYNSGADVQGPGVSSLGLNPHKVPHTQTPRAPRYTGGPHNAATVQVVRGRSVEPNFKVARPAQRPPTCIRDGAVTASAGLGHRYLLGLCRHRDALRGGPAPPRRRREGVHPEAHSVAVSVEASTKGSRKQVLCVCTRVIGTCSLGGGQLAIQRKTAPPLSVLCPFADSAGGRRRCRLP